MIVMAVSLVIALIWASRMSAPIIALTKSARKLAEGDLSVKFSGKGYTEIKELADTLNYATTEISKSEVYRNELVANVSHDLRTPLTLIKFYGEMIRDVSGDDEAKREEACDTIIREADWLTEMVNEMLELTKLQQALDKPKMAEFNISESLLGMIETVKVMVERDGYEVLLDIDAGLMVNGNEQGLKRAMYNLIGNALNYTGEDKRITVRLKSVENGVRFEVSDTGAGIAEDEALRVWDRYYKSGITHKRSVIGTGIGLAIVKAVLEGHNARYGVESPPSGGARFWFSMRN
jgi:signal transduction histidine kinase